MRESIGVYSLLIAIIEQAVRDIFLNNDDYEGVMSASYYLFEDKRNEPFSFNWICAHLDLDAIKTRESIKLFIKENKSSYGLRQKLIGSTTCIDYIFKRYIYDTPLLNNLGVYFYQ